MKYTFALVALLISNLAASGENGDFIAAAHLGPEFEVPPVIGVDAHGSGAVHHDESTGTLSWTIEYVGMTSTPTGGHIHGPALAGANAGIIVNMLPNSDSADSPIVGSVAVGANVVDAIRTGQAYFNLHTAANGSGEIRGQLRILDDEKWEASLDPGQEVHVVTGADDASGSALFHYDAEADRLSWRIEHAGMSADPTGGHIHATAEPGVNAGVVLNLLTNSNGSASPIIGSIDQPDLALLGFLEGRRAYVNLHTPTNGAGEIRGQLSPIVFESGFE